MDVMMPSSVSLAAYQADLSDPDHATRQTVGLMCDLIQAAAHDTAVQSLAESAVNQFHGGPFYVGGDPRHDPRACAVSSWWLAKQYVRSLPHSEFKALVAAFPEKRQLLIAPGVLIRSTSPAGDCSTFTMLICALLECLGVPWELVTVAVDPAEPMVFSHVYAQAVLPGNDSYESARLPLDASHGEYPGWQVPAAHVFRYQAWGSDAEPLQVQRATPLPRLNGYQRVGLGAVDICVSYDSDGNCLSSTSLPDSTAASTDSGSSAAWANALTQALKSGMTLAQINAIQPGTVVGANGQILRQATGLPVPVGSGITAALGSNTSSVLLLGGAALFFAFMMFQGKR